MLFNFNWDHLINSLPLDQGDPKTPNGSFYLNTDGRFDQMITAWKSAGYDKSDSVEWINYYPSKHFTNDVVKEFEKWSNTSCARCWISRIRPGKMAPLHQDIDDHLEEYLAKGQLIRYNVFISEPSIGAVFICNDQVYHLQPQGTVIKWDHYMDWHAGTNCGLKDKFMFNFLGVLHDQ
jgi:hypothetical protein